MRITISTDRYVCFDENGVIDKITRKPDENFENLLVDFEDVRHFNEGKESLRDYKVEYDFVEKKYVLKSRQQYNESFDTQNFVYEIPHEVEDTYEIKIKQNNVDKCWELYSVTKLYDPNVLYKTLDFSKTKKIPFDSKFEFDNVSVSLYTVRKFSTYYHEVVNG